MELFLRIALIALVGYALLVGGMYVFQRSLMYFPAPGAGAPAAAAVPEMAVHKLVAADGVVLVAWYAHAASGQPTLVYFHGNGGNIADRGPRVRPFINAGHGVLLLSYRGYGGSKGRPSEDGLYADGRAALDFLAGAGVLPDRVVLLGESLGSAIAVRLASERRVAAVILEAPFTSAADVAASAHPFVPARWLVKDRYASIERIADIGVPLLIVHGEADRIVPARFGRALLAVAREPKRGVFLVGAGHNDLPSFGSTDAELAFLAELFAGLSRASSSGPP